MRYLKTIFFFSLVMIYSCSSDNGDNDVEDRFPFTANIEYRVSSSVDGAICDLYYVGEQKESVNLTGFSLPFVIAFDVQVEYGDSFYINGSTSKENLKVSLYIDGELIKEVESSDPGNNSLSIVHQFGLVDTTSKLR